MELGLNSKSARPSEIIRAQAEIIRQQDELIDFLKAALAAAGSPTLPVHASWMTGLTRQERALIGVLVTKYPRAVPRDVVLEVLPGQDHVRERQLQVVDAVVHKVRRKLGAEVIITERGCGFRLGRSFHDRLSTHSTSASDHSILRPETPSFA
jgi:DNA-binding response OmpR family regulator